MDRELNKTVTFYEHQEKELLDDLAELEKDVELQEEIGLRGGDHYEDYAEEDDEDDDDSVSRSPIGTRRRSISLQRKSSARRPTGV